MTQWVAIMVLVLLVIGLLVCYVLTFKHWKRQRIHQDIEKKLKRYPTVQAAWEKAEMKQYNIPGLAETKMIVPEDGETTLCQWMTPQGLAFSQELVFISVYCYDHQHHSVIHVLDRETGQPVKLLILPKRPHVGGLVYDPERELLWLTITGAGTGRIAALRLIDILADSSEATGQPINYWLTADLSEIPQASYLTQVDDQLVSGTFTLKGEGQLAFFSLPTMEAMKTAIRRKDNIQISVTANHKTPNKIQGIASYGQYLLASRSFGPYTSELVVLDRQSPHRILQRIKFPPYLEQIVVVGNQLAVLFESGAAAYREKAHPVLPHVLLLDLETLLHKKRRKNSRTA
jgi:hypothetical protein